MLEFDMAVFDKLLMPIVVCACLCIGYILKHWVKDAENKYIPTILATIGAVIACIANKDVTVELIVSGIFSGLASTGLHQMFKQLIEKKE